MKTTTIENISITVKKNKDKESKNEISIGEITINKTKKQYKFKRRNKQTG